MTASARPPSRTKGRGTTLRGAQGTVLTERPNVTTLCMAEA